MTTRTEEPPGAFPASAHPDAHPFEQRLLKWSAWAAVALAIAIRVSTLWDKPFWRDEAWVALLVDDPMRAATDARAVPLGFLWLVRLTSAIPLLPPEVTYRLVPLAAGIAAVPLLAKLAATLGASRRTGVIAMWFAAAMHALVYYSRELKSYDLDLLLTIVLPLLAVRGFVHSNARARYGLLAALVVAPWISFAGLFPTGAVLAWGWLSWWRDLPSGLRRDWIVCSAAFLVSFAVVYAVALGAQSTSEVQYEFWGRFLVSSSQSPLSQTLEAMRRFASISAAYPFSELRLPALLLAVIGAWTWPRPWRSYLLWLLLSMAGLCLLAAALDRYVVAQGRHLLFVIPVLVLWAANGLHEAAGRMRPGIGLAVALVLPMLVAFSWSKDQIEARTRPFHSNWTRYFKHDVLHDMEGALLKVDPAVPKGAPFLVTNKNSYAFQFYARGRLPQAVYCPRHCFDFKDRAAEWLRSVEGKGWILATDEEVNSLGSLVKKAGFEYRTRNVANGMRLWAIERVAASPEKNGNRGGKAAKPSRAKPGRGRQSQNRPAKTGSRSGKKPSTGDAGPPKRKEAPDPRRRADVEP